MAEGEPTTEYPSELEGDHGGRLIGVSAEGVALYYDEDAERTVHAVERDGRYEPDLTTEYYFAHDESLDDVVGRVADAVGWASLTSLGERVRD